MDEEAKMGANLTKGHGGKPQLRTTRANSWHDPVRQQEFLENLAASCNVTLAARAAGLHPKNGYRVRASDPAFAERWRRALILGHARLHELLCEEVTRVLARAQIRGNKIDPARLGQSVKTAQWLLSRYEAAVAPSRAARRPIGADELRASINAKLDAAAEKLRGARATHDAAAGAEEAGQNG